MGVVGQRLYDRPVERRCLVRAKQLPHGKDVSKSCFLEFAKYAVTAVNRCSDKWTIAMFRIHRFCQLHIISLKLEFECAPSDAELLLEQLEPRLLARVKRQFMMQDIMQLSTGLPWRGKQEAANQNAADRSEKTSS